MAKDSYRGAKSESLTIRLDPMARFMLDFVSRLRGQPLTTVVERAIAEAADKARFDSEQFGEGEIGWHDIWSVHEGERALKMAEYRALYPRFDEVKRLAFCKEHWPFFYSSPQGEIFRTHYVDILWPKIDTFIQIHEEQKSTDYFAAGQSMRDTISAANLRAPDWPVKVTKPKAAEETQSKPTDADDAEIPF
jgi:hypothetical protein